MRTIKVLKFVAAFGWGGTERQFVNLGLGLDRSRFACSATAHSSLNLI